MRRSTLLLLLLPFFAGATLSLPSLGAGRRSLTALERAAYERDGVILVKQFLWT